MTETGENRRPCSLTEHSRRALAELDAALRVLEAQPDDAELEAERWDALASTARDALRLIDDPDPGSTEALWILLQLARNYAESQARAQEERRRTAQERYAASMTRRKQLDLPAGSRHRRRQPIKSAPEPPSPVLPLLTVWSEEASA